MAAEIPNKIEKEIELNAPLDRVWAAVTEARRFSAWFGVNLKGEFRAGAAIEGNITSAGYEHFVMKVTVKEITPQTRFSFLWIPHAIDTSVDYSKEEPTLVTFTFEPTEKGTRLRVTEEGFDHVPLVRRAKAFEGNSKGWEIQMKNVAEYLENEK